MMSLRTRLPENDVVVVENAGMIRLESPTVTALARAFIDNGLGSYADAILCIVPALGDNFRPDKKQMLSVVIKGADNYRKEGEWKRAETLMRWACQCYSSAPKEEEVKEPEATAIFTEALLATGELYRWSLAQLSESGRRFGLKGIAWMQKVYGHHHHQFLIDPPSSTDDKRPPEEEWGHTYAQATEIKEIIERYRDIASKFCKFDQTTKDTPQIQQLFIESLQSRNRTDALYYLCLIAAGQFGSSTLSSALPLAVRNDWKEVVDSVLELGADPNSQDSIGRTAISYCAELGYEEYFDRLLELSASPDLPDQNQQSPLFWAAEAGQERLLELLLAHPQVDPSRRDNKLRTPLTGAMLKGHERAFQMLLDAGRGRIDINAPDSFNITPLYWAVESGSKAFARMLLKEDCILPSAPNRDTRDSALSSAVRRQEADIVQLMLDAGAKVDYEATYGARGQTALIVAADVGNEAIFKMLLETNKFDVNKRDRWGDDALTTAKRAKSGGIVQMLTERPDIGMEK